MANGDPPKRTKVRKSGNEDDGDPKKNALFLSIEQIGHRFVHRWLGNPEDRKEVVQDVALDILIRMEKEPNWIVPGQPLEGLLYRIFRNKAADRLRDDYANRGRLPEYERRELQRGLVQLDSELHLEEKEAYTIIERALMKLPPAPREVWRAIEQRGQTHKQVAAARGVSVSTIRAQHHHANCAVKPALGKYARGGR